MPFLGPLTSVTPERRAAEAGADACSAPQTACTALCDMLSTEASLEAGLSSARALLDLPFWESVAGCFSADERARRAPSGFFHTDPARPIRFWVPASLVMHGEQDATCIVNHLVLDSGRGSFSSNANNRGDEADDDDKDSASIISVDPTDLPGLLHVAISHFPWTSAAHAPSDLGQDAQSLVALTSDCSLSEYLSALALLCEGKQSGSPEILNSRVIPLDGQLCLRPAAAHVRIIPSAVDDDGDRDGECEPSENGDIVQTELVAWFVPNSGADYDKGADIGSGCEAE